MKPRSFRGLGLRLAAALVLPALPLACSGSQTPPSEPAPTASAAPAPEPATDSTEPGATPPAPEDAGAPPAPPQESLLSLCNKMCDAVAPKCSKTQLESCRVTCK